MDGVTNNPEGRPDHVNSKWKTNDITPLNKIRETNSMTSLSINNQIDVPSCSTTSMDQIGHDIDLCVHKGVTYERNRLTSLGYRIDIIKAIATQNQAKFTLASKETQFILIIDLMFIVGSYSTSKQAKDAFNKLKVKLCSLSNDQGVDGYMITYYGKDNKEKHWCTYEFFMRHIIKHVRSDLAKDMCDASFVNDITLNEIREANGMEIDIPTSSKSPMDHIEHVNDLRVHRGVQYEPSKLTSLGYRIDIVGSIAHKNTIGLLVYKEDPNYILIKDLMYVIGSYETYKVASNAFDQIIPIFDGNEDLKSVIGLLKTKYNRGHRYYCTYEFFMRHLVKHVRSDFATHLLDASFVNDLVLNQAIENNDLTGLNEARANNKLQPLSISALQTSISFENGDAEHKSVRYHKAKLTSLGYRIEIIRAIVVKKQFKLRSLTGHIQTILIIDLLKIVGDYKNDNAVKSALENLKVQKLYNDCKRGVDGLIVTKYNSGDRYWCSYDYFMRNLVPHINSDFAKHLIDASFVNDLVTSSGSNRAEALLDHNRSINAQCSTSQAQLENIVDQGLQSTSLKTVQPLINPAIDVSIPRGVYIAKTSLKTDEGYNVTKIR